MTILVHLFLDIFACSSHFIAKWTSIAIACGKLISLRTYGARRVAVRNFNKFRRIEMSWSMVSACWCLAVVARRQSAGAHVDDRAVLDAVIFQCISVVERPAAVLQVNLVDGDVVHICSTCQQQGD